MVPTHVSHGRDVKLGSWLEIVNESALRAVVYLKDLVSRQLLFLTFVPISDENSQLLNFPTHCGDCTWDMHPSHKT